METIYAIGPAQAPLPPLAPNESELSGCLNYGLQKAAYDIRGSGVLLVQDLHVPCRGCEVTVAEPVPYPLQVDALVDQPRSMRVPDLVGRVPERQMGLLDRSVPDAVPGVLAHVFGRVPAPGRRPLPFRAAGSPALARAAVVSTPLHATRTPALSGGVGAHRAVFVLLAIRQRVGVPEDLHFFFAHPLTTSGHRASREQPHREDELARPDAVRGDVLPDHLHDLGVDLHPAVLAVLGVPPGQEPVPVRVEVRGHLDRRLADVEHAAAEVEVFRDE